ncbi:hypothetical protein JK2ML_1292 [Mycobacterium leprae Kyoto-2]|uniref:Uncharacterized protein n=3 Tax=Mycobacterium leprae TaxID=1769 RepID=Q7AQ76_MYCLE|nr:hypothetical protein DIJ64_03090 [Mycobacterium leprae]OAR19889.1 hypothetical protein A8144_13160 [Mycobacterium leprae 3125609]OAX70269.1 hypothetical protein A3216_12900 [Mycobacterium leprae 7935681]CAR71387.1 hypothetical protein MLBr01292 [Mycobacterium leprae Br4923]BBC17090.1 hypothetical protein JK2ML_1292 [Mycobacterium leprae Kyoto-2]
MYMFEQADVQVPPSTYYTVKQQGFVRAADLTDTYDGKILFDLWMANLPILLCAQALARHYTRRSQLRSRQGDTADVYRRY